MRAERDEDEIGYREHHGLPWVHIGVVVGIIAALVLFWFREDPVPSADELASPAEELPQPVQALPIIPATPDIPRAPPAPPPPPPRTVLAEPPEQPAQLPEPPPPLPTPAEADAMLLAAIDAVGVGAPVAALANREHPMDISAAVLDGMSRGMLVRKLLPGGLDSAFPVDGEGDVVYMSTAGYRRYDALVRAVETLDVSATVAAFHRLRPLFERSFGELGLDPDDFDNAVLRTLDQVLATPEIERQLRLERKSVMYTYAEPELEALPPLQKQLLRMGPDNVRALKATAAALRSALLGR